MLTEVLDRRITSLRAHRALQTTDLQIPRKHVGLTTTMTRTQNPHTHREPGSLKPIRNQIQKVDKLAEHDALRRGILQPEIAQLFHEGLDLRRGSPIIQIQPTEDTLPSRDSALFNLHRRCF